MDIRTGKIYRSREEAIADGAAPSDVAYVVDLPAKDGVQPPPRVTFSKQVFGSFKNVPPVAVEE